MSDADENAPSDASAPGDASAEPPPPLPPPGLGERRGLVAFAVASAVFPPILLACLPGIAVSELWAQHPESDRWLFGAGGAGLLETARLSLSFWRGAGIALVPTAGLLAFGALFVWSAVLDGFCHHDRLRPRDVAASSVVHVGRLAALYGVFLIVRAATIGATVFFVQGIAPAITRDGTERAQTMGAVVAALVGLGLLEMVRVLHDLAMVAAVRHEASLQTTLLTALGALREGFFRLCARRLPYAVGSLLLLGGATLLASTMWEGAATIAVRATLHLGALGGVVALRVAWLRGLFADVATPPLTLQSDEPSDL